MTVFLSMPTSGLDWLGFLVPIIAFVLLLEGGRRLAQWIMRKLAHSDPMERKHPDEYPEDHSN